MPYCVFVKDSAVIFLCYVVSGKKYLMIKLTYSALFLFLCWIYIISDHVRQALCPLT